jgi:hypothetical protein
MGDSGYAPVPCSDKSAVPGGPAVTLAVCFRLGGIDFPGSPPEGGW